MPSFVSLEDTDKDSSPHKRTQGASTNRAAKGPRATTGRTVKRETKPHSAKGLCADPTSGANRFSCYPSSAHVEDVAAVERPGNECLSERDHEQQATGLAPGVSLDEGASPAPVLPIASKRTGAAGCSSGGATTSSAICAARSTKSKAKCTAKARPKLSGFVGGCAGTPKAKRSDCAASGPTSSSSSSSRRGTFVHWPERNCVVRGGHQTLPSSSKAAEQDDAAIGENYQMSPPRPATTLDVEAAIANPGAERQPSRSSMSCQEPDATGDGILPAASDAVARVIATEAVVPAQHEPRSPSSSPRTSYREQRELKRQARTSVLSEEEMKETEDRFQTLQSFLGKTVPGNVELCAVEAKAQDAHDVHTACGPAAPVPQVVAGSWPSAALYSPPTGRDETPFGFLNATSVLHTARCELIHQEDSDEEIVVSAAAIACPTRCLPSCEQKEVVDEKGNKTCNYGSSVSSSWADHFGFDLAQAVAALTLEQSPCAGGGTTAEKEEEGHDREVDAQRTGLPASKINSQGEEATADSSAAALNRSMTISPESFDSTMTFGRYPSSLSVDREFLLQLWKQKYERKGDCGDDDAGDDHDEGGRWRGDDTFRASDVLAAGSTTAAAPTPAEEQSHAVLSTTKTVTSTFGKNLFSDDDGHLHDETHRAGTRTTCEETHDSCSTDEDRYEFTLLLNVMESTPVPGKGSTSTARSLHNIKGVSTIGEDEEELVHVQQSGRKIRNPVLESRSRLADHLLIPADDEDHINPDDKVEYFARARVIFLDKLSGRLREIGEYSFQTRKPEKVQSRKKLFGPLLKALKLELTAATRGDAELSRDEVVVEEDHGREGNRNFPVQPVRTHKSSRVVNFHNIWTSPDDLRFFNTSSNIDSRKRIRTVTQLFELKPNSRRPSSTACKKDLDSTPLFQQTDFLHLDFDAESDAQETENERARSPVRLYRGRGEPSSRLNNPFLQKRGWKKMMNDDHGFFLPPEVEPRQDRGITSSSCSAAGQIIGQQPSSRRRQHDQEIGVVDDEDQDKHTIDLHLVEPPSEEEVFLSATDEDEGQKVVLQPTRTASKTTRREDVEHLVRGQNLKIHHPTTRVTNPQVLFSGLCSSSSEEGCAACSNDVDTDDEEDDFRLVSASELDSEFLKEPESSMPLSPGRREAAEQRDDLGTTSFHLDENQREIIEQLFHQRQKASSARPSVQQLPLGTSRTSAVVSPRASSSSSSWQDIVVPGSFTEGDDAQAFGFHHGGGSRATYEHDISVSSSGESFSATSLSPTSPGRRAETFLPTTATIARRAAGGDTTSGTSEHLISSPRGPRRWDHLGGAPPAGAADHGDSTSNMPHRTSTSVHAAVPRWNRRYTSAGHRDQRG
ncbi:unnamed protein product [Amoebophrya sp. A120]|nr:unnamed protein product [Amoebophrya sp. A120]|eukprot:GSA120T00015879001.1